MGDEFMESYEEVEQDRLSIWMTFEHGIYILKHEIESLLVFKK